MAQEFAQQLVIQTDDRRLRRFGVIMVIVIFFGIGGWSALAPLSSAASAPGIVTVENYRKTVQHLEGGIIKTIHVRDGQSVSKDQVLISLEDTLLRSQLEVLRGRYIVAKAREARLLAQRDGLSKVNYPSELRSSLTDARVKEALYVQDEMFRVRKAALQGEASLYEQQISQLAERLKGLRSQKQSREHLINSYTAEQDDFKSLLADGYTEKQKVRELDRNLAQNQGSSGELSSTIAATEYQINEIKLQILQLENDMQREVAKELSEGQTELFELREKMQSLDHTIARSVIKSPEAGMVLGLSVHTLGAVIPPGGKLLEIVPQSEKLIVEARISPMDIDRVQLGQTAEIRFSAFKSRDTPKIEGKLVAISADRLVDEKSTQVVDSSYYLARVETTRKGLLDLAKYKLNLVPGMPAEVLINSGERTLLQYLMDPFMNSFAHSFNED